MDKRVFLPRLEAEVSRDVLFVALMGLCAVLAVLSGSPCCRSMFFDCGTAQAARFRERVTEVTDSGYTATQQVAFIMVKCLPFVYCTAAELVEYCAGTAYIRLTYYLSTVWHWMMMLLTWTTFVA